MKQVRIGIVGAGGIANGIHLPNLAEMEEACLRAVCDLAPGRAEQAASRFGIPGIYTSYHEMLAREELDAVYVLTEPDVLFRAASACLESGKHVFMEKPMGINLLQAKTLRELALAHNRRLHTGFNRRFIPLVSEAVKRMRELTAITHVEGRFYKNSSPAFYGGCADAFTCDVIHVVDLVRHIAASGAEAAVTMESPSPGKDIAGAWYSMIRFQNGVTGLVRSNYHTGGRVHTFEIHGEGASAYIDLGFGGEACRAVLLHGGQGQSMASGGASGIIEEDLDGIAIAGSGRYERYYGYYDESRCFLNGILDDPGNGDAARTQEDYSSMLLIDRLLRHKI